MVETKAKKPNIINKVISKLSVLTVVETHFEVDITNIEVHNLSQPHFEGSVRSPLTLPKMGLESPPKLPKTQSSIAGVKTPRLEVFFILLEKVLKCRSTKWPRMSHSDICSTSYGRKKGGESNWQFDSRPLKVGNQPDPSVCR